MTAPSTGNIGPRGREVHAPGIPERNREQGEHGGCKGQPRGRETQEPVHGRYSARSVAHRAGTVKCYEIITIGRRLRFSLAAMPLQAGLDVGTEYERGASRVFLLEPLKEPFGEPHELGFGQLTSSSALSFSTDFSGGSLIPETITTAVGISTTGACTQKG